MSKYSLVSVDNIISKSIRDGLSGVGVSEADTVEMIGEALEFIGAFGQYEENVLLLDVKDHKASLPEDLIEIIQLAYTTKEVDSDTCLTDIGLEDNDGCDDCSEPEDILNNCWHSQNRYYIPEQRYYDAIASYNTVSKFNSNYYDTFRPLKLDKSNFRSAKGLHSTDSVNLYCEAEDTYSIHRGYINTSFQTGTICIAYLQQPLDDRGYPLIPDNISYKTAITSFLKMQLANARYTSDPTPSNERMYNVFSADWHWYCKQAKNSQLMPSNLDEREQLYRSNMRLVKKRNSYSSFFSGTNSLENFKFNVNG